MRPLMMLVTLVKAASGMENAPLRLPMKLSGLHFPCCSSQVGTWPSVGGRVLL
ncbi:Uncharacterised protein [Mycobacteroides abscessus subsp. massiliense]|nr:Uncharacterised protein [Mycobacteroides abscessus subsp. massiliense]